MGKSWGSRKIMSKMNKRTFARILLILVIVLAVVGFYFIPRIRSKVTQVLMLFRSMSVESIVGYLRSFGVWAVVISFLLMMFQSIIAPLPAFLITFANAAVFWLVARSFAFMDECDGGSIGLFLYRTNCRTRYCWTVEQELFAGEVSTRILIVMGNTRFWSVVCLSIYLFDFISYAAGLTAIKPIPFLIATGIGQLPATVVYSYVGSNLTGSTKTILFGLLSMFALFIAIYVFKQMYQSRQARTNKSKKRQLKHLADAFFHMLRLLCFVRCNVHKVGLKIESLSHSGKASRKNS